jgi:hypothetical protein
VAPAPLPRADATTRLAGAFTAELKDLPPAERWKEMARIEAQTIAAGVAPPHVLAMAAE